MNKLKFVVLGLSLIIGSVGFSQQGKSSITKKQRMEEKTQKVAEELGLSQDQKVKFVELRQSFFEESQKLKSDNSLDQESKKTAMKTLRKEHKAKVSELLSEEQLQKFEEMKAEKREKHREGRSGKKHKGKHQGMKKENRAPVEE